MANAMSPFFMGNGGKPPQNPLNIFHFPLSFQQSSCIRHGQESAFADCFHPPLFAASTEYVGSASSHFTSPEGP
jgi:hypothetical protein